MSKKHFLLHIREITFIALLIIAQTMTISYAQDVTDIVNKTLDSFEARGVGASVEAIDDDSPSEIDVLELSDKDVKDALRIIGAKADMDVEYSDDISGQVDLHLENVRPRDAIKLIVDALDLSYLRTKNKNQVGFKVMNKAEYEKFVGMPFKEALSSRIFTLKHAKVKDVVGFAGRYLSAEGKFIVHEKKNVVAVIDLTEEIERITGTIKELDVLFLTEIFDLKEINMLDIKDEVEALATNRNGQVQFDESSNTMIVTETQDNIDRISDFIDRYRKMGQQIVFDVKVIQITLSDEQQQGVDWEAIVSNFRTKKINNNSTESLSLGTLTEEDFDVLLDALDTVGVNETVFNRKDKVDDTGKFNVVLDKKSLWQSSDIKSIKLSNYFKQKYRIGLFPQIQEEGDINIKINTQTALLKDKFSPQIFNENSEQKEVNDINLAIDSTLVMGGVFINKVVESNWKIPLLGDIPLLRIVFSNKWQVERKTEVIVFITPKMITREN